MVAAGHGTALKETIMHPGADPLPGPPASAKPPGAVTVTRAMLIANAVVLLLLATGVYLLAESDGPTSEAVGRALFPALPAILNLVLALQFGRGGQRLRWAVVAVEAFTLLLGLGTLGQGGLAGLLVVIFSIVALISVNTRDVRTWLQRPRTEP
jgi:hypothetical protein